MCVCFLCLFVVVFAWWGVVVVVLFLDILVQNGRSPWLKHLPNRTNGSCATVNAQFIFSKCWLHALGVSFNVI